ncbi:ATP-binding domain-containing protein [Nocardia huaxiensis]|uniref:ATP-binding domain-containing protein n=1 Tax=Nocardia huaxiensis TaxID=2755382 RepID=A0A7D6ZCJ0_9NOCA|nr:ATP-binding domain-containing protein [Nocardia huaxiensis]QLY30418.1 ATP-binding domain-containing protein [Nocardia huaxiensis]
MNTITVVRGTNDKPAASDALVNALTKVSALDGQLFIGYPIINTAEGSHPIDAVLVSPSKGVIVFDLVDGAELGDYGARQDESATALQQRLLGYRDLVRKRKLKVEISSITFAPAVMKLPEDDEYSIANMQNIGAELDMFQWADSERDLFERTISAIQSISTIRRSRSPRKINSPDSRGARLQKLERSIATLDMLQSKAVIETVDGVQRIRGLAGSGKTIVLALKAAYLHAQHPEWRIAVTFNTRSLKEQYKRLITSFSIETLGEEPDWDNVRIVNSWGAPGGADRDGLYFEYCMKNQVEYYDFRNAQSKFGRESAFNGACASALAEVKSPEIIYDAILIDEAQDLPPEFLRLCYSMLDDRHRLVYAYDELQTLNGDGLPPAESIFGSDNQGRPNVSFESTPRENGARRDIVLEKCYRNSRPVLVSAHGLGFGIYRKPANQARTGLVQMFDQPSLWTEIGYSVKRGALEPGREVSLVRTEESSPRFLEEHSTLEDLVEFKRFASKNEQDEWVADEIERNIQEEELRHSDIIVINTNPLTTRGNLGPIRTSLLDRKIMSHLAGVDVSADVFFNPGSESVTFTGIYRAKGNEAGMVYIVNAEECQASHYNLARVRNRLFTAMTRSKAWVRVLGVGPQMDALIEEFEAIKSAGFELNFRYPSQADLQKMQIVHRDMTAQAEFNRGMREQSIEGLLRDFEDQTLFPDDLSPELLERLRKFIGERDQ